MTDTSKQHPFIPQFVKDAVSGKISRREFLAYASSFGLTTAAAYSAIGLVAPTEAKAAAKQGG